MSRKEWREVSKQSLYFVLATAGMVLLMVLLNLLQGKPQFAGETIIIILSFWLLMFSMFLGLSPFAMDSKQKGMEYLLTLPYSRRRLLLIKLLPRLAAIVVFYLVFVVLYGLFGNDAIGGGFTFFSLAYFALFFISYSLSVVHENFIVQSIWAGIALCGYLALGLYIVMLGFSWKFKMPGTWGGSRIWQDLSYDIPTLLSAIAVFLLLAAPFILSIFLVFSNFDLKPARAFNRRQLLIFVPLLLLASAASLGVTYLVQSNSRSWESSFFLLGNGRLLQGEFPGKLTLYDEAGRREVDTKSRIHWERLLLEQGKRLYLGGHDTRDGAQIIGALNLTDLSWRILHRVPARSFVTNGYMGMRYDGQRFVYLRCYPAKADQPGMDSNQVAGSGVMELVRVDPAGGESRTIRFRSPLFRKYFHPWFIGSDERNGRRFWLIANQWQNVLRLWEDGRVEDLGLSKGFPAYANGLLFTLSDHSLVVRRLLDEDSETVKEIEGKFVLAAPYLSQSFCNQASEIYAKRDQRIVRIDLARPNGVAVDDVGTERGSIWQVTCGEFYYVEFESWPGKPTDKWRKLYRLQGGKMIFLKEFDFDDAGYGHVWVSEHGVIFYQQNGEKTRFFAFPDLRELKFKNFK
jgi:hypothetical protein